MSIHMTQGIPISQYSTLLSAIPHHSNSAPRPAPPPNRLSLPQTVYVPKTSTASSRKLSSVYFDMHGAPSGYGVPLPDILARGGGRGLDGFVAGVSEEVFRDLKAGGVEKIQFRIVWPGYEHMEWMRTINLKTPSGWMTKGQLVFQIGTLVINFVEKAQTECINPANKRWAVGRGQIGMDHIVLISLVNTYATCFQAEIQLSFRM